MIEGIGARQWKPVLDGAIAAEAERTVTTIAEALAGRDPGEQSASLGSGLAGEAIFFAYLSRVAPERGYEQLAMARLDRAIDEVAERPMSASLYGGFIGVAWALEHLERRFSDRPAEAPAGEDANEATDEALLMLLGHSPWQADYDLIGGLVGHGVYALERWPRPSAAACLRRIVERLEETAERLPEGVTWWTRPELLIPETRALYPAGYYNLGVAHGVPGVIALLAEIWAAGIERERVRALLDGAVRWLLTCRLPDPARSSFPTVKGPKIAAHPARAAWCYGDPGIAATLLLAAHRVGEPEWEKEAVATAARAALRSPEGTGILDAGICHGAAGLAHIYNRFYQATGDPLFRDAAGSWTRATLGMCRPGHGLAGYLSWVPGPGGALGWAEDASLLTGIAGIGLVLLAAGSSVEPSWDRILLSNV